MTSRRSLDSLTAGDFRAVMGTRFRLAGGSAPASFEAMLADVTGYAASPPGTFRAPFAVVFHGPADPVLPQGIYLLEHHQLGALELFLVPVGPDQPGEAPAVMRYEAVFG